MYKVHTVRLQVSVCLCDCENVLEERGGWQVGVGRRGRSQLVWPPSSLSAAD